MVTKTKARAAKACKTSNPKACGRGAAVISSLEAQLAGRGALSPDPLPTNLPLSALTMVPELFQVRGQGALDEEHLRKLGAGLKADGELTAVLIMWIAGAAYLLDGFHRTEAYRRAKITAPIPIETFKGTLKDALIEAGRRNTQAKLQMSDSQRQDCAWALVKLRRHSIKEIAVSASVCTAQVSRMRGVLDTLGGRKVGRLDTWRLARRAAEGDKQREWDGTALQKLANSWADQMRRTLDPKMMLNPKVAAMAIEVYFGRHFEALHEELSGIVEERKGDEEEDGLESAEA